MQATASLEELQSLQMILHEGPVRISPRTAQEIWNLGLDEVWLVVPPTHSPVASVAHVSS